MRIVARKVIHLLLSLFIASIVVIVCYSSFSSSINRNSVSIPSSNILVYLFFNSIILAIIAKEQYDSSRDELGMSSPLLQVEEDGERTSIIEKDEENGSRVHDLEGGRDDQVMFVGSYDGDDHDDDCYHGSDGYVVDDDDSGSYGEIGWEDDDDGDDNEFERRVEAFISKVVKGWKEECFNDLNIRK